MNKTWILIVLSLTVFIAVSHAKKASFDENIIPRENSERRPEPGSCVRKSDCENKGNNLKEEYSQDGNTKDYARRVLKDQKAKKWNKNGSKEYAKVRKTESSAKDTMDEKVKRNKREAPSQGWYETDEAFKPQYPKTMKIKKKELSFHMDQENMEPEGAMMPPFEPEIRMEQLQTEKSTTEVFDETEPPRKSKTIKKYQHDPETAKKGKKFEKEKKGKQSFNEVSKDEPSIEAIE